MTAFTPERQAQRQKGLFASEIAAVLNLNPYQGGWPVWAQKTGRLAPKDIDPKHAARGKRFEPMLLDWLADDLGLRVEWNQETFMAPPPYDWFGATPDGLIYDKDGKLVALAEAKAPDWRSYKGWGAEKTDDIPTMYIVQMVSAQEVFRLRGTPVPISYMPVWLGDFKRYDVPYRPELAGHILRGAERFWKEHVLADVPPPVDATDSCAEVLGELFGVPKPKRVLPTSEELETACARLANEKAQAKFCEQQIEELKNRIKLLLGAEYDSFQTESGKGTWRKPKDRKITDHAAICRDLMLTQPELAPLLVDLSNKYTKAVPQSARFTFTANGEESDE